MSLDLPKNIRDNPPYGWVSKAEEHLDELEPFEAGDALKPGHES